MVHHRIRPIFSSAFFLAAAVVLALVWIGGATAEEPQQGEPKQGEPKKAEECPKPTEKGPSDAELLEEFKLQVQISQAKLRVALTTLLVQLKAGDMDPSKFQKIVEELNY